MHQGPIIWDAEQKQDATRSDVHGAQNYFEGNGALEILYKINPSQLELWSGPEDNGERNTRGPMNVWSGTDKSRK